MLATVTVGSLAPAAAPAACGRPRHPPSHRLAPPRALAPGPARPVAGTSATPPPRGGITRRIIALSRPRAAVGGRSVAVGAAVGASEAGLAKTVLVPIADGSEEIEAVTVIDVLRRAGAEVVVCSVEDGRKEVVCSRGVRIVADVEVKEIAGRGAPSWDLIVIPGGMPGSEHIGDHIRLHMVLEKHFKAGRPMGAICAAPAIVFEPKGFLEGFAATAHPAFVEELGGSLEEKKGYAPARVLVDNQIITSRGPGTAMEFALCLVERLYGPEKAAEVADPMVVQPLMPAPQVELEWRLKA